MQHYRLRQVTRVLSLIQIVDFIIWFVYECMKKVLKEKGTLERD